MTYRKALRTRRGESPTCALGIAAYSVAGNRVEMHMQSWMHLKHSPKYPCSAQMRPRIRNLSREGFSSAPPAPSISFVESSPTLLLPLEEVPDCHIVLSELPCVRWPKDDIMPWTATPNSILCPHPGTPCPAMVRGVRPLTSGTIPTPLPTPPNTQPKDRT